MTFNKSSPGFRTTRHLALSGMLASQLAQNRGKAEIELSDYVGSCYIADPNRFLSFWSDPLTCIEALRLECDLEDPAWTYQWKLTQEVKSAVADRENGWAFPYSDDLAASLLRAAELSHVSESEPQIDLAHFLLAISSDSRFAQVFATGFRVDLARDWVKKR